MKKTILRCIGTIVCICFLCIALSDSMQYLDKLPANIYYTTKQEVSEEIGKLDSPLLSVSEESISVTSTGDESLNNSEDITVSLFGVLPIRTVSFIQKQDITLLPSGHCVGINISFNGVLVVATGDVVTATDGTSQKSPAAAAGIVAGDYILAANSTNITSTNNLEDACKSCDGTLELTILHDGKEKNITVSPVYDSREDTYKLGAWVREDTAGIGTISYYDPQSGRFAALGHPVTDVDTGDIFTIGEGNICACTILQIVKGSGGIPGELTGAFSSASESYGSISTNSKFGISGELYDASMLDFLYPDGLRLAYPDEVKTGDATLLCAIDGDTVHEYSCRIIKKVNQRTAEIKGLVVEITDSELLEKTGGIVQGMSGSPIIQNNMLVGAVTHVMINNPTRGYGMYAYWQYIKNK